MSKCARTAILLMILMSGQEAFAHDASGHHKSSGQTVDTDSFDVQMGRAMERMDRDMAVPSTGDPDRDFAAMMIPHHQGAVDMARIQLQFGKDPVLRRLAQGIIVEQLQEIDVMRSRLTVLPQAPGRPDGPLNNDSKDQ
jgi:uncharacterized protein (DUF305 family)